MAMFAMKFVNRKPQESSATPAKVEETIPVQKNGVQKQKSASSAQAQTNSKSSPQTPADALSIAEKQAKVAKALRRKSSTAAKKNGAAKPTRTKPSQAGNSSKPKRKMGARGLGTRTLVRNGGESDDSETIDDSSCRSGSESTIPSSEFGMENSTSSTKKTQGATQKKQLKKKKKAVNVAANKKAVSSTTAKKETENISSSSMGTSSTNNKAASETTLKKKKSISKPSSVGKKARPSIVKQEAEKEEEEEVAEVENSSTSQDDEEESQTSPMEQATEQVESSEELCKDDGSDDDEDSFACESVTEDLELDKNSDDQADVAAPASEDVGGDKESSVDNQSNEESVVADAAACNTMVLYDGPAETAQEAPKKLKKKKMMKKGNKKEKGASDDDKSAKTAPSMAARYAVDESNHRRIKSNPMSLAGKEGLNDDNVSVTSYKSMPVRPVRRNNSDGPSLTARRRRLTANAQEQMKNGEFPRKGSDTSLRSSDGGSVGSRPRRVATRVSAQMKNAQFPRNGSNTSLHSGGSSLASHPHCVAMGASSQMQNAQFGDGSNTSLLSGSGSFVSHPHYVVMGGPSQMQNAQFPRNSSNTSLPITRVHSGGFAPVRGAARTPAQMRNAEFPTNSMHRAGADVSDTISLPPPTKRLPKRSQSDNASLPSRASSLVYNVLGLGPPPERRKSQPLQPAGPKKVLKGGTGLKKSENVTANMQRAPQRQINNGAAARWKQEASMGPGQPGQVFHQNGLMYPPGAYGQHFGQLQGGPPGMIFQQNGPMPPPGGFRGQQQVGPPGRVMMNQPMRPMQHQGMVNGQLMMSSNNTAPRFVTRPQNGKLAPMPQGYPQGYPQQMGQNGPMVLYVPVDAAPNQHYRPTDLLGSQSAHIPRSQLGNSSSHNPRSLLGSSSAHNPRAPLGKNNPSPPGQQVSGEEGYQTKSVANKKKATTKKPNSKSKKKGAGTQKSADAAES